jgi:hypothetical protein
MRRCENVAKAATTVSIGAFSHVTEIRGSDSVVARGGRRPADIVGPRWLICGGAIGSKMFKRIGSAAARDAADTAER